MSDSDKTRRSRNKHGRFKKKAVDLGSTNDDNEVSVKSHGDRSRVTGSKFSFLDDHSYVNKHTIPVEDFIESEVECITTDESWQKGRRIVELDILADGLKSCFACDNPLSLHNTVSSKSFGLANVLDIFCDKCGQLNNIDTGRKHGKIYDMNTKLAIAMAHSGVGMRQINSILSALNIPPVYNSLLVRRQNEAGQALEDVAESSTEKYLQEEVNLNSEKMKLKSVWMLGGRKEEVGRLMTVCLHKHDPVGIGRGLDAVVCHIFGDHTFCDDTWCRFIKNPSAKYSALPYGRPLKDTNLKQALQEVFASYKKTSDKLSKLGSTQANESLNKSIASKAPKQLHLSGSANLNYRVAAGVAQKNLGNSYLTNVNKNLGISPGTYTSRLALLRDLQHRKRKAIAITRAAKQKRIQLKQERYGKEAVLEVLEGPTYATDIDEDSVDITTIPPSFPQPSRAGLDMNGKEHVYFDLETTGLERTSHIIQIAAAHDSDTFSTHVIPQRMMSHKATEVTGVSVAGQSMFYKGQPLDYLSIHSALDRFFNFLQSCSGSPVILVGHNIESFDCKVLLHAVHNCKKHPELQKSVYGFMDTYKIFRKAYPDLRSHKQEALVQSLLGKSYMAHSALEDVLALQELVNSVQLDKAITKEMSFSLERAVQSYEYACNISTNIVSLQQIINKKVISKGTARLIAGSGLKFCHLCVVYKRNGIDGLRMLLSEVSNGKVRVTKSERIITAIADYLNLIYDG